MSTSVERQWERIWSQVCVEWIQTPFPFFCTIFEKISMFQLCYLVALLDLLIAVF